MPRKPRKERTPEEKLAKKRLIQEHRERSEAIARIRFEKADSNLQEKTSALKGFGKKYKFSLKATYELMNAIIAYNKCVQSGHGFRHINPEKIRAQLHRNEKLTQMCDITFKLWDVLIGGRVLSVARSIKEGFSEERPIDLIDIAKRVVVGIPNDPYAKNVLLTNVRKLFPKKVKDFANNPFLLKIFISTIEKELKKKK